MIAGVARIDITPDDHVWMDGMIRSHKSVGVHDPLYARALFMSPDGSIGGGFVVVTADICGLDEQKSLAIRKAAETSTGLCADRMVLAATHTHSGPATVGVFNPLEEEFVGELSRKIVTVIARAIADARPAAAGCASGREDTISHYRRLLADDGHVVMNWEPYSAEKIVRTLGEPDPEVGVLKITDAENPDATICVLFNHAGHPNVMSGENYLISADYPGVTTEIVEEKLGCIAMFANGAQGSVDIDGLRDRDWVGVDRVGGALAVAAIETARNIAPSRSAHLRVSSVHYTLSPRKISPDEMAWAEDILRKTGGHIQCAADGVGDDYKARLYKELRAAENSPISIEQVCFAVDDAAFISIPCELFTEIGMRIKQRSPFDRTYIMGMANGFAGYIPTQEAIAQGGYEVDTRCADNDADTIIEERSLALLREVKAK